MEEKDLFTAYCAAVCSHVRCRFVRKAIAAELDAHMEDHAAALRTDGSSREDSRRLAVEAMGDPAEVGEGLNRLYPPVLYWLIRILGTLAGFLLVSLLLLAVARTAGDRWDELRLFPAVTPAESLSDMVRGGVWNQTVIATGTVTGGGTLGDYTFTPITGAQLVHSPAFDWDGVPMESYDSLQFILEARHAAPWLGSVEVAWARPTMTDGAGRTASVFDEGIAVQVSPYRVSPLRDYIEVYLTPFDVMENDYIFTLTGPDGRVLTFTITLTEREATP